MSLGWGRTSECRKDKRAETKQTNEDKETATYNYNTGTDATAFSGEKKKGTKSLDFSCMLL